MLVVSLYKIYCMRFIITIFFTITLFLNSFSQTGKIEGKVTDSKTGAALSGVSVTSIGSEKGSASDIDGRFVITLGVGTHTIRLSSVGYNIKELSDVEVTSNTITSLDVVLESAEIYFIIFNFFTCNPFYSLQ